MKYNESNFIYLKKTSMEKYYEELVKAEHVYEYFPKITKIIIRKVTEGFLKNIAEKLKIESNVAVWNLLNDIKLKSDLYLSDEIRNSIEIILVNGYEYASQNKKNSKHPIEILEIIHNILCWYLKKNEPQKMISVNEQKFKAPKTIEYHQKELDKIKEDISLKDNQINNLREKIIELSSQSKSISELNKIIIAIKEEKSYSENIKVLLIKKIEVQKNQVADIEKKYKTYIKKFEQLEEKCKESQKLVLNKESQLVKAEIQMRELKNLVKELDEQDKSIEKMEQSLQEELRIVRNAYEYLVNLAIEEEDILETIEFSYDMELQKVLDVQKNNITMEMNFQDAIFNKNINIYTKNIIEAKRKIIIFREILNENIKKEIKYKAFYRGFLRLDEKALRIIYTMISNVNISSNLINRSKELLSKSSEDKFLQSINKNIEQLKNISDDEIKLIVYYKLIKLSQNSFGHIYNRKQFVQSLDSMIDRAYEILMIKKDFKGRIKRIDAINAYYLKKIIDHFKNINNNIQINEELADKIYKNIIILRQSEKNVKEEYIYHDKFDLDSMSEESCVKSIRLQPFVFLSIMLEFEALDSYKETYNIIFEVAKLINQKSSVKEYEKEILAPSFSNEYFMILLFLPSRATFSYQRQEEELFPLIIMAIMSIDLMSDNDIVNLENYNKIINLWNHKQQNYNDIFIEKEDKESELKVLIKEKQKLEDRREELLKANGIISEKYNNYKEEFNNIIMNSEKRILLPSFMNYDKLRNKKEQAENHINESKNKFGTLKNIFSPEIWKEQASKIINESNMIETEKLMIEEAKQKPYFKKEYMILLELEEKIQAVNELIIKCEENLKNKNLLIDNIKIKINELQRQLNNIKDVYLDIEEGYY